MLVPYVSGKENKCDINGNRFINEQILFSNNIIRFDNCNDTSKFISIPNVEREDLELTLKDIFSNNKNTTFYIVQYSTKERKIYLYTDKQIKTNICRKNNDTNAFKTLNSPKDLLEEIKYILQSDINKDKDAISLYDLSNFLKEDRNRYISSINNLELELKKIIQKKIDRKSLISFDGFDYEKKELKLSYLKSLKMFSDKFQWRNITFSKEDGKLYIKSSETILGEEILKNTYGTLSKLYELCEKEWIRENEYGLRIKALNSNLIVNIGKCGIYLKNSDDSQISFKLTNSSLIDKYSCKCISKDVINVIKESEVEIFKKILIRIDDCPEWMRFKLSRIRKMNLEEQQKQNDNKSILSKVKRKILSIFNK